MEAINQYIRLTMAVKRCGDANTSIITTLEDDPNEFIHKLCVTSGKLDTGLGDMEKRLKIFLTPKQEVP